MNLGHGPADKDLGDLLDFNAVRILHINDLYIYTYMIYNLNLII